MLTGNDVLRMRAISETVRLDDAIIEYIVRLVEAIKRADLLRSLAAGGTPMLMICGLYQLFGEYFETVDGSRLDGIGVIGAYTVGQGVRMIGNLTEHSADFGDIIMWPGG